MNPLAPRCFTYCFTFCLLFLVSAGGHSKCECLWQGSFVEVHRTADLVVSGAVLSAKGNSIDIAVDRVLRGEPADGPLRIWLKTGDYCRPPVSTFPPDSQWVMALHEITEILPGGFNPATPSVSYGRIGDYALSSCGGYWLNLSDERVSGNLINAPRWDREPKMTPVLLDLVAAFVAGKLDKKALLEASREDPALRELMLDTRAFLRNEN